MLMDGLLILCGSTKQKVIHYSCFKMLHFKKGFCFAQFRTHTYSWIQVLILNNKSQIPLFQCNNPTNIIWTSRIERKSTRKLTNELVESTTIHNSSCRHNLAWIYRSQDKLCNYHPHHKYYNSALHFWTFQVLCFLI